MSVSFDANRSISQSSQEHLTVAIHDFKPDLAASAEGTKSVWSQQSNPFQPTEPMQNWQQAQSPFDAARNPAAQFSDSQFSSPVQGPPNYIKSRSTMTIGQFGGDHQYAMEPRH